jgi:acid phosphatase
MCDANKAMFATVAEFNDGKMTGVNHVPLQKLVDLETNEEKTVTLNPGAW